MRVRRHFGGMTGGDDESLIRSLEEFFQVITELDDGEANERPPLSVVSAIRNVISANWDPLGNPTTRHCVN